MSYMNIWAASSEFGTYRLCEQRRFRRACASAQSRRNLRYSLIQALSRGTFRRKARSLAPLNGWACSVKICHDGMLEDTNSLDGAHLSNENKMLLVVYFILKAVYFTNLTALHLVLQWNRLERYVMIIQG